MSQQLPAGFTTKHCRSMKVTQKNRRSTKMTLITVDLRKWQKNPVDLQKRQKTVDVWKWRDQHNNINSSRWQWAVPLSLLLSVVFHNLAVACRRLHRLGVLTVTYSLGFTQLLRLFIENGKLYEARVVYDCSVMSKQLYSIQLSWVRIKSYE